MAKWSILIREPLHVRKNQWLGNSNADPSRYATFFNDNSRDQRQLLAKTAPFSGSRDTLSEVHLGFSEGKDSLMPPIALRPFLEIAKNFLALGPTRSVLEDYFCFTVRSLAGSTPRPVFQGLCTGRGHPGKEPLKKGKLADEQCNWDQHARHV